METEKKYLEKPWLKSQAMGCIPETLMPYPEDITYTQDLLDKNVKKYPNELAVVCFDYEMTWKKLKEHVDRFATALADMGIKKGDVVATVLPSCIQYPISDFAISEIGAIHNPDNILDSVDGLVDKFNRAGVKTVICVDKTSTGINVLEKIKEAKKKTKIERIILTREDYSKELPKDKIEGGIIDFKDLIRKYPPNPPKVNIDPKKDLCLLFFTGGTTGIPKGVMLTHYNVVACSRMAFGAMMPQSVLRLINGFMTTLIPLPICHLYGQEFYRYILWLGSTIILQTDPRDPKEYIRLVKKYHPVFTPMSPTQYGQWAKEEEVKDLGMLGISGSMALAPKTQETFEKKAKSILFEAHGTSETSGACFTPTMVDIFAPLLGGRETASKIFHLLDRILNTPSVIPLLRIGMNLIGRKNLGMIVNRVLPLIDSLMPPATDSKKRELATSVGYPLVDEEVKVINEDTGEVIPIPKLIKEGLRGEVCLTGPHTMLGYWPEPGSGLDNEGYVHTGDVVKMDEAGRVYIVDRTKDMINVSGYKVYSREIDDMLYQYPGVYEAATVGVPDPERPGSERVKVFIAPYPEYRGKITEKDIIEYLKERVEKWAVPKSVEFRDELPKSPVEKIFKKQLREEEIEKMKKEGLLR